MSRRLELETLLGYNVSRETIEDLSSYLDLVILWNGRLSLVGSSESRQLWSRHIVDSARLMSFLKPGQRVVDLGSGAGFPGVVLALIARKRFKVEIVLCESDVRKRAFLYLVSGTLRINCIIIPNLAVLTEGKCDLIVSRAMGSMSHVVMHLVDCRKARTKLALLKGKTIDKEIRESSRKVSYRCTKKYDSVSRRSCIIIVESISA